MSMINTAVKVGKVALKAGSAAAKVTGKAVSTGISALEKSAEAAEKAESAVKKVENVIKKTEPVVVKTAPVIKKSTVIITAAAAFVTGAALGFLLSPLRNGIMLNFGVINDPKNDKKGDGIVKRLTEKKCCKDKCVPAKNEDEADDEDKPRLPRKDEIFKSLRVKKAAE